MKMSFCKTSVFSKELNFLVFYVNPSLRIYQIPFLTSNDYFKILPNSCFLNMNLLVEKKPMQINNSNKTVCLICACIYDHHTMLLKTHELLCSHDNTSGIPVFPPSTEICSQISSKVNILHSQLDLCVFSINLVFLLSQNVPLLYLLHFPVEVD